MNNDVIVANEVTKTFWMNNSIYDRQKSFSIKKKNNEQILALDKISFKVKEGEVMGIIGSNGSGKTTLLRLIAGIYQPDNGSINVKGKIAPLLQIGVGFHNELSAKENILMYGMLLGLTKSDIKQRIDSIIAFAELEKFVNMKLKHYSAGMRVRLAFSTSLQIDPDVLLVDEVLSVGDMSFKEKSFKAFMAFKDKGKTIIFTSHNLEQILQMCDHVLLLHEGKLIMTGKPEDAIKRYKQLIIDKNKLLKTQA